MVDVLLFEKTVQQLLYFVRIDRLPAFLILNISKKTKGSWDEAERLFIEENLKRRDEFQDNIIDIAYDEGASGQFHMAKVGHA